MSLFLGFSCFFLFLFFLEQTDRPLPFPSLASLFPSARSSRGTLREGGQGAAGVCAYPVSLDSLMSFPPRLLASQLRQGLLQSHDILFWACITHVQALQFMRFCLGIISRARCCGAAVAGGGGGMWFGCFERARGDERRESEKQWH